ncbi:hypothetical protein [Acidimangrovimonas pyrenivorans]|uniref:Lipoprotein n=1 Tax=Acidimangrovimonas pyrenivorans TaxID=2030798 RepID=A0ABV7AGA5_9RHOB
MRLALFAPLLLAACATVQPGASGRFVARNGLSVTPTGPETFHVAFGGLIGTSDFWCAAGEYVTRRLGRPIQTMVYRASPPPRRAGEGISFTLNAADAQKTGLISLKGETRGYAAGIAEEFCEPPEIIRRW